MALLPFIQPLTGDLDFVLSQDLVEAALKVQETFNCPVSAQVGDLVVPSESVTDTVEPIYGNVYPNLVFGAITSKPTPSTAVVLVSGRLQGSQYNLTGLVFGRAIYVGTDGRLTTTPPTTGHLQCIGLAIKQDSVFLNPSVTKIVRP